jgi:hypothetical protein
MATQIQTWQVVDGQLHRLDKHLADTGRTEAFDLEAWIASHPAIVEQDLLIIGRQVQTKSGPLDLLAVDRRGSLVVIELKRDKLPREALVQAIDYASDVANWSVDKLSEVCTKYTGKSLEDCVSEVFPDLNLESLNINESQRIILVGFSVETSLERMINWLSTAYNFDVNAVVLHYIMTSSGDELLAKTAVISEEVAEQRVRRRKFQIPMSDEPGTYEKDELRQMFMRYLSQDMVTAQRIRDILLPAALKHKRVQREKLKEEFVKHGIADEVSKAGLHLTGISQQLGLEKNAFLRQVIGYEYPNYPWEKDNYFVRDEYRELVKEILKELMVSRAT